jgi:hypothetical protein
VNPAAPSRKRDRSGPGHVSRPAIPRIRPHGGPVLARSSVWLPLSSGAPGSSPFAPAARPAERRGRTASSSLSLPSSLPGFRPPATSASSDPATAPARRPAARSACGTASGRRWSSPPGGRPPPGSAHDMSRSSGCAAFPGPAFAAFVSVTVGARADVAGRSRWSWRPVPTAGPPRRGVVRRSARHRDRISIDRIRTLW